jgi:DNA-binding response OmpR family regulator
MPKQIVVVDDEPDIRQLLDIALTHHGYTVQLAKDGQEGLELIRRSKPDLAILDVKMPRLNGFELLVELRKDDATKSIPVIMLTSLTAGTGKSDEMWRNSLEINDFLSKPFDTKELLIRTDRILSPP